MESRHKFSVSRLRPQVDVRSGNRTEVDADLFPILKGLSMYVLDLKPDGIREPHWHPNANELIYCVDGKFAVTIFAPGGMHESFEITPGEIAFIPIGYLHSIENIGKKEGSLLIAFNHERPETIGLSIAVSSMLKETMSVTCDVKKEQVAKLHQYKEEVVIVSRCKGAKLPRPLKSGRHKFGLQSIDPQVATKGGTISLATKENFAALKGITLFDLRLQKGGIREPHWHPNAAELDYVVKGKARMIILSPNGERDIFEVEEGDLVFIPPAYFHYIENIGKSEMHFAIFFNHESPEDIGISGSIGAYSNDVLASVFQVKPEIFQKFSKPQEDRFVVAR